ncbi:PilZ domain-containing protein [Desulfopila sp. IMCC35006]|uniref:PilZ domain-containing protein n=1 Tax=Desulfopila sp. IMCC35006 TaxID=2569542 RepID=UPI0010AB78DA|nr:PilZ domain-containing protein [Desulfopila sp. IMCC35006]TKB25274.1 PilZ domain-containing protein [Desulfopila sp. IMCC35006]
MANQQRPKIKADIKQNRLYITLSGHITKNIIDKVYTEIRFCVVDLKPGFDVITDLSQCTIGNLNGISTVRKIMDYLIANQAGQIVRVIGKKGLFFKQSLMFATRFQGYSVAYVATLQDAEEKITNYARRNALRFPMYQQQIEYRINQQEGRGEIIDISVGGCAVRVTTALPLTEGMEISLTIPLHQDQDSPVSFTLAAKVVRAEADMFAVQFLDLSDERKEELYKCLAYEAGREILRN